MCIAYTTANFPCQSGTFVTADEPASMHHHPESTVYVMAHSWYCAFSGFGQVYSSVWSQILCVLPVLSLLWHQTLAIILNPWKPFYCLHSFSFSGMSHAHLIQSVTFSHWLLSSNNAHLRFLHVFWMAWQSFLFGAHYYIIAYVLHLPIKSPTERWLPSFGNCAMLLTSMYRLLCVCKFLTG